MDTARRRPPPWLWVALGGVVAAVIAIVVVALTGRANEDPAPVHAASPNPSDACAGVDAEYIDLDQQVVGAEPVTCFVLDERMDVTVGAAALAAEDTLVLTVRTADGEEVATATSEADWDPEVGLTLDPAIYIIEVSGVDGAAPDFLLYTATFPASTEAEPVAAALPTVESCGSTTPLIADDAPVAVTDGDAPSTFACLVIDEPTFVKVGLASADPSDQEAPDLQLALYRYEDEPVLVRSADDTIGFDPEMSVELTPGTYALEATAWYDRPTGAFDFYVDSDEDLFRHGEVTSLHAETTPGLCATAPELVPGDAITVEGEQTYLCITVPDTERLTLEAATLGDQDLVLEVMGFEESGAPYRLAWADENPYSEVLANFDPLVDQVIPSGTWLVAVTTYFTGTAANYDVALQPVAAG